MTDKEGYVTGIRVTETTFNNTTILNEFERLVAIDLLDNKVDDINLSDFPELRSLYISEINNLRTLTQLRNVNKLAYFKVWGLNTPNFKKFTWVKNLRKIDMSGMGIESFDGLENMPNLKEAEISSNEEETSKNFKSLSGIPKGHKL